MSKTPQPEIIIKNGLVVRGSGIDRFDIAISGGKVTAHGTDLQGGKATRVIDASGRWVLPGALDVHYHPMYGDNLAQGSIGAAYGGITTMVPFVYAYKGMGLEETIDKFLEGDGARSTLDFGIHLGILDPAATLDQIPRVFKRGVNSMKFFMAYRKRGMMAEDNLFLQSMESVAAEGGLTMVHAENGLAIDYLEDKFIAAGKVGPEWFEPSRPKRVEYEAVYRAIQLAAVAGSSLYLVHMSTGESVEIIRRAREDEGLPVVGETCPQYLELTNDEYLRQGPVSKMAPPYRTKWDNETLWKGLASGAISTVGSDHSPHPRKNKEKANIFDVPVGTPQVETMLQVLYDRGVHRGRITLPRLVQVLCENPAKCFGLYPRKGSLDVGADADLVFIDPARAETIRAERMHTTADYNTYEGWTFLGKPVYSMQRGRDVLVDGRLVVDAGRGEFLSAGPPVLP
ncbi:MAG: dihydropyrimidinase [Candidatus Tectomicrobia bacterium]|nr:dihydropyrimidinase [Candidatus Tectomicrobia bacterium]